ncbi:MAG: hypothetical protein Q7U04_02365 [Bacteriovorax sp.]|nr:hypothetical protein [Bacteriovorax sp.]
MNAEISLKNNWQILKSESGKYLAPADIDRKQIEWINAIVPGTVAQALGTKLEENLQLDSFDWWYHTSFTTNDLVDGSRVFLNFLGLATFAEVWLNGELILSSKNMFVASRCDVTALIEKNNEIYICFHSIERELKNKTPRPRWKTNLVNNQNLRFIRTSLLGRIPGWTPAIQAIGPWKEITLEIIKETSIELTSMQSNLVDTSGEINLEAKINYFGSERIHSASIIVDEKSYPLILGKEENSLVLIKSKVEIINVPLWWPHTHGDPTLLSCRIELLADNRVITIDCGKVGFKSIKLNRQNGLVEFQVNNIPIFCRGACWTTNDFISLVGDKADLEKSLQLAVNSGLNMFRVGGTMVYESDDFYRMCDHYGILIWQDFMFANMDYPVLDLDFKNEIESEAIYQIKRLQKYVSLSVYCGGSEIEQQAAMMGLPKSDWSNDFFKDTLPTLINKHHTGIPYFPSSPCEGALPIHLSIGISHYYGVGAYKRNISEVKHANVKFAAECLGFSNVPMDETLKVLGKGQIPPPHSPLWKSQVPRDTGAGWDFEDIRDFYFEKLFNIDPIELRSHDLSRYLEISRVVSGEVMKRVFSEWRKAGSVCRGGLVWFFRDLTPGAGWGIVDSLGYPKAVWYDLKRVWAKQAVLLTDEGLDGIQVHLLNETAISLKGILEVDFFIHQKIRSGHVRHSIELVPRESITLNVDELLGHFSDHNNVYRFGPAKYDVIRASLKCAQTSELISEAFYFPTGLNLAFAEAEGVQVEIDFVSQNEIIVTVSTTIFLQNAYLSCHGYLAEDNYFHMAPNQIRKIKLTNIDSAIISSLKVELSAINLRESILTRASFPKVLGS